MRYRFLFAAAVWLAPVVSLAQGGVAGKWTSTFATQVGEQSYTYDFTVKGTDFTGSMKSNMLGDSKAEAGKVDGQKFTFTEVGSFMEMPLRFAYVCELTSAAEAKCTRTLEGFEAEALVMKRAK